jgi:hypothetical protein
VYAGLLNPRRSAGELPSTRARSGRRMKRISPGLLTRIEPVALGRVDVVGITDYLHKTAGPQLMLKLR